jgi:hypothetical protein
MYKIIKKLLPEGVNVSYKKNVITITYPDGTEKGGYKNFETAIRAAARKLGVKLNRDTLMKAAYLEAVECAKQAIELYNDWLAGDCWGVCVDVVDAKGEVVEEVEACWGYIERTATEKALKEEVEGRVKYLRDHPE